MGKREEKVSTQTKSPLSPLIRFFFYQNGLKHRTLGIFSFLQEAFLFNPTVGSLALKPHVEVGAEPGVPGEEGFPSCTASPLCLATRPAPHLGQGSSCPGPWFLIPKGGGAGNSGYWPRPVLEDQW